MNPLPTPKFEDLPNNLPDSLNAYRLALARLERWKSETFYHGTPVMVDNPRYHGPGVAVSDNSCWPDHVTVCLPNGNCHRYPMEFVRPSTAPYHAKAQN